MRAMPLASLTRFRLRSNRHLPAFLWWSLRSARQARRAPGHLAQELRAWGNGEWATMTLWTDEAAMRAYRDAGPHKSAMQRARRWARDMASLHYEADALPTWDEARRRLDGPDARVLRFDR